MDQLVGLEPAPSRRGTINIFYSCVSTLIICVWTTVRVNVGPEDESSWQHLGNKAGWTLFTIIFPEYMLFKAVILFIQAKEAVRRVNEYHERNADPERTWDMTWTLADGFFSRMQGFAFEGDVLDDERIVALMENKEIPPVRSYAREIRDRSKTDSFAQLVACLQASWLAIQCIARKAEGLPMSLLEFGTLAYVLLSIFIYGFLWLAPKDVETRISIFRKSPTFLKDGQEKLAHDREAPASPVHASRKECSPGCPERYEAAEAGLSSAVGQLDSRLVSEAAEDLVIPPSRRERFLPRFLNGFHRNRAILRAWSDSGVGSSDGIKAQHPLPMLLICGCIAWGVLHCLAWHFYFPSPAEKWLWRICSIMSTVGPWVYLRDLTKAVRAQRKNWGLDGWFGAIVAAVALTTRLILLVEMFISLRRMPSGVYENVRWSFFVPHL